MGPLLDFCFHMIETYPSLNVPAQHFWNPFSGYLALLLQYKLALQHHCCKGPYNLEYIKPLHYIQ